MRVSFISLWGSCLLTIVETPSGAQPHSQGGMMSNSTSPPAAIIVDRALAPPPIVAIPRRPGPADMMVPIGTADLRTLKSFSSIEACEAALPKARRSFSNAFCVSTAPPEPEPDHAELLVFTANELLSLESFPSLEACEKIRAQKLPPAGAQSVCTKLEMH